MPQFGWIKNHSLQEQSWGRHSVAAQAVGLVPIEVIETLRQKPLREISILSDDPEKWVFKTTPHQPFSARYRDG
jgi:hypothetical protein